MPTIEELINAIPTAEDDHVITSTYHNTLRDALKALAGLGQAPGLASHVSTITPNLLGETSGRPAWGLLTGVAKSSLGAYGWAPVQLPTGATIVNLKALVIRPTGATRLVIQLQRQLAGGAVASSEPLARIDLPPNTSSEFTLGNPIALELSGVLARAAVASPFVNAGNFIIADFGASEETASLLAGQDGKVVDNYKYMITAELAPPATTTTTPTAGETDPAVLKAAAPGVGIGIGAPPTAPVVTEIRSFQITYSV